MAAPSETYIDPATGTDSGATAGTIGDPFASLQYAYDNTTFDTTNGHIFYVKNGTADNTSNTSLTFANRTADAPMWVIGYGGGKGHINTGIAVVQTASYNYLFWQDMEITSTNTSGLGVGSYCGAINCQCNCSVRLNGNYSKCLNCVIDGGNLIVGSGGMARNTIVTSNLAQPVIDLGNNNASAIHCIAIAETGATSGIELGSHNAHAINCSIYTGDSVAVGISHSANQYQCYAYNNLIEGFTTAIDTSATTYGVNIWSNSSYGETTLESFDASADEWHIDSHTDYPNESLGSSPFVDAANGDFTPVNVGSVASGYGAVSGVWRGAVSPSSSGGGITVARGMHGGMRS